MLGFLCFVFMVSSYNMTDFKRLKNALLQLDRESLHLSFLKSCKEYGVIPKFLQSRCFFSSTFQAKRKYNYELGCLKTCIRTKYALVASISRRIYGHKNDGLYYKFCRYAVGEVFNHSMRLINRFRVLQNDLIANRHEKKLDALTMGMSTNNIQKAAGFVNLSSHTFDEDQLKLLNKGPKHILRTNVKARDYIPELEDLVKKAPPEHRNNLRSQIFLAYNGYLKRNNYHQHTPDDRFTINSIRNIPGVVFLTTDKSNKLAAIDSADYVVKMTDAINTLKCTPVTINPLPSIINKCKCLIKEFKTTCWSEQVNKSAKLNTLGLIPRMIGVIKDHKLGMPIRPIVIKCESPTFYIEKTLVLILREILPASPHVLTSTLDFVQRLEAIQLPPNFTMYSLDVVALYPSVDMKAASQYISNLLASVPSFTIHMCNTIMAAFQLIINSNYFQFNNQVYLQDEGAPMGSPLSGLAAECILRPLEEDFLVSTPINPISWFRYVDDVFILWPATEQDFNNFVTSLNTCNPKIQFTIEKENNCMLPFLDVLCERKQSNISRTVYRKKMNSNCTIPQEAYTTNTYKQAAYKSYISRAYKVCTPDTLNHELNTIRHIATQNGFSIAYVNDLINKMANRNIQHPPTPSSQSQISRVPVTYIKGFHEKLGGIMKQFNIHLVARSGYKLKNILKPNFDAIPTMMKPGVYEVPIAHQDGSTTYYIGQTSRKLEVRLKEHQSDIKRAKQSSALARTIYSDPSLVVRFDDSKVVAPFTSQAKTIIRESIEIHTRQSEVVNDQDSFSIPAIWLPLL